MPAIFGGVFLQVTLAFLVPDTMRTGKIQERMVIVIVGIYGIAVLALTSIFLYGNQGRVYVSSMDANNEIRKHRVLMFKRYFVSCPVLKIYFGDYNFFEPGTALAMEDIVLDNTV